MTEEGRGTRSLRVPSTIEVSAAQRGRAGRPLLCFVRPARHDQLLQGYPSSSSAGDDSATTQFVSSPYSPEAADRRGCHSLRRSADPGGRIRRHGLPGGTRGGSRRGQHAGVRDIRARHLAEHPEPPLRRGRQLHHELHEPVRACMHAARLSPGSPRPASAAGSPAVRLDGAAARRPWSGSAAAPPRPRCYISPMRPSTRITCATRSRRPGCGPARRAGPRPG